MREINATVCIYLRYQTVQLIDSASVRGVRGQPLGSARRPTQLLPDFHLLPEDGGCSDVCASLQTRTQTHAGSGVPQLLRKPVSLCVV